MSEWELSKFKDRFSVGLRNGLNKPSRVRGSGMRMVNMKEIFGYDFIDDKTPMELVPVSEKEFESSNLESGDLLFARQSLTEAGAGKVAIFQGGKPTVFESHLIRCRINKQKSNPNFLYYLFKSPLGKGAVSTIVHQVAAAGIKGSDLQELEFQFPKLEEQKAISSVLSSLDDKIDLLHSQNSTLERMAETLFRQWFVEEALDSNIAQFIELQSGYAFKSNDFKDNGIHRVLKIKNISGGIIDVKNTDFLDTTVPNKTDEKFKVMAGDVLFAMTGAEIGKLGIVPKTNEPLWLNQRVGLLKEKYQGARFLAYLQLNSDFGQDYIENSATGSAQPNISGGLIEQCPFPKVEANRIKECAEILNVYYQKLISNLGQIQTIEQLRDTLLPKLMSGEIRISYD